MNIIHSTRKLAWPLPPLLALTLSACASFSADGGFHSVQQTARQRLGQTTAWQRSATDAEGVTQEVQRLLDTPFDADVAVHIALINNRTLQASYSELGMAEATLVQAATPANPGLSLSRTHGGDDIKIERSLTFALLQWLSLPAARTIQAQEFEQTQLRLAEQMLRTAAATRKAYYQTIAARQSLQYQEQVQQAAQLAHELAVRMAARGNFSQLDAAREQSFLLQTETQLARARVQVLQEQENLLRLLGLTPQQVLPRLPPRLPTLPPQAATLQHSEQIALQQRLDIQAARQHLSAVQNALGLTQANRFINVLDLGYVRNSESAKDAEIGYALSLEIPLFDWGQARVAKAQALYMQAVHQLAATVAQAQSEVRLADAAQQQTYRQARQYLDVVLPLRKRIADETMLRYNGMLVSVFDLLADAREQASAVNAAIDAARDYWVADADLQLALGGSLQWAARQDAAPPSIPATGNHHE